MRPAFFVIVLIILSVGTSVYRFQSSAEKAESAREQLRNAQNNVEEEVQGLDTALIDSIQRFNEESAMMIALLKYNLASLKQKLEGKTVQTDSERKLSEMETKLNELKWKLSGFNDTRKDKWDEFRKEFSQEMTELEDALISIADRNG